MKGQAPTVEVLFNNFYTIYGFITCAFITSVNIYM